VANFSRLSDREDALQREYFSELPIVLTEQQEVDELFSTDGTAGGWAALGDSAIVRFSRVGFDCHQSQALMYESYSCGSLCGSGDLLLLVKTGTGWRVVQRIGLWIA
jgi:hypothetical protein